MLQTPYAPLHLWGKPGTKTLKLGTAPNHTRSQQRQTTVNFHLPPERLANLRFEPLTTLEGQTLDSLDHRRSRVKRQTRNRQSHGEIASTNRSNEKAVLGSQ